MALSSLHQQMNWLPGKHLPVFQKFFPRKCIKAKSSRKEQQNGLPQRPPKVQLSEPQLI
jgi:hypothetical protein